jgi:hypothetical protein
MSEQNREQKLEAAFIQLLELTTIFLKREKYWKEHYGCQNRVNLDRVRAKVEQTLFEMGVNENTNFNDLKIEFKPEN